MSALSKQTVNEMNLDIGDLTIGEKIGNGSFSNVFKATLKDPQDALFGMNPHFACKIINKKCLSMALNSKQFEGAILREEKALNACKDIPFTLRLHGTNTDQNEVTFITDLHRNGDLSQCLERNGPFSLPTIRYYASCIIRALDKLQSKGIIHRDLKPENILLNESNEPVLCDFGCVKLIGPQWKKESVESDPDFVGTPQFMPPEMITIPKAVLMMSLDELFEYEINTNDKTKKRENAHYFNEDDGRLKDEYYKCSDLWSLGCLLYQLRTGQLLFDGDNEIDIFKKIKTMNFSLHAIKDKSFKEFLSKLLTEDPMKRIGANNINQLKNHSFFDGINWNELCSSSRIKQLKEQIHGIVNELFVSEDIDEAIRCVADMDQKYYTHQMVKDLISSAMDRSDRERELASQFLAKAVGDNFNYPIPRKSAELGFTLLLERVDDFSKDVPNVLQLLSSFIARGIIDEILPPSFVEKAGSSTSNGMTCSVMSHVRYLLSGPRWKVTDRMANVWQAEKYESVTAIKREIGSLIREYLVSRELNEALICIQELHIPMFHHEVIKQLVVAVADYYDGYHHHELNNVQINLAIDLISATLQHNIITEQQIKIGFDRLLNRMDDYQLDCVHFYKYYWCIVSPFQQKNV